MDDASLDDFLEDSDSPDGSGDGHDDGQVAAPDAVDPATTTYVWAPDGAACAACGNRVERRWQADAGLVCSDCKEW